MYLYYIARPHVGPEGIWIGLLSGMSMTAGYQLLAISCIDWKKEMKIKLLKMKIKTSGEYISLNSMYIGSRSIGGIDFMSHEMEVELEDLDQINLLNREQGD